MLNGIPIFMDDNFGWESVQWFVPKSKKRRIREKCRRKCRRTIQKPMSYFFNGAFICNSAGLAELKKTLAEENERNKK